MILSWSLLARRDLLQARRYIAHDDPAAAQRVSARILGAADRLVLYPGLGRVGREEGTRELVVPRTPYVLIYRLAGETVEMLRVLHGAQRWPPRQPG